MRAARAQAVLSGRDFVTPDDVREIAKPALRHRIALAPELQIEGPGRPTTCCMRCWRRWRRRGNEIGEDAVQGACCSATRVAMPPGAPVRCRMPYADVAAHPQVAAAPAPATLVLLMFWALLGLAASIGWLAPSAWQAAGLALLAAGVLDAWRVHAPAHAAVCDRRLADTWPIGVERPVTLNLETPRVASRWTCSTCIPAVGPCAGCRAGCELRRGESRQLDYHLRANERGDFRFDGVQLRLHSPWRLWWQSRVAGEPQRVRVYPNFAPLARFAMFSAEQASRLVGAHVKRRRGEGTDFHQMREYRVGDSLRQIDWKATARARRLISREYQDEKNQQLVLMLDTGRRLLARDGELAHFDHVLDAALVVAYLALRQGDARRPARQRRRQRLGAAATRRRRDRQAAARQLRAAAAAGGHRLPAAATELSLRQRRRALVMLVTNLRDEDMDDLLAAVQMLRKRHLVCVASLREGSLDAALARGGARPAGGDSRRRHRAIPGTAQRRARSAAQPRRDGAGRRLRATGGVAGGEVPGGEARRVALREERRVACRPAVAVAGPPILCRRCRFRPTADATPYG